MSKPTLEEIRQIIQRARAGKGQNQYSSSGSLVLKCIHKPGTTMPGLGSYCLVGTEFFVWGDERVLEIVVMVIQHWEPA